MLLGELKNKQNNVQQTVGLFKTTVSFFILMLSINAIFAAEHGLPSVQQYVPPVMLVKYGQYDEGGTRLREVLERNIINSDGGMTCLSHTPTNGKLHQCYDENSVNHMFSNDECFMAAAFSNSVQLMYLPFLKSPSTQYSTDYSESFKHGVPGAYIDVNNYREVCEKGNKNIHRDVGYYLNPFNAGENKTVLIISVNYPTEADQLLIGSNIYDQFDENKTSIMPEGAGEVTLILMNITTRHSVSHDVIPDDFFSQRDKYKVCRSIYQGYIKSPDTDTINWDLVAYILSNNEVNNENYLKVKQTGAELEKLAENEHLLLFDEAYKNNRNIQELCSELETIVLQFSSVNSFENNDEFKAHRYRNLIIFLVYKKTMCTFLDAFSQASNIYINSNSELKSRLKSLWKGDDEPTSVENESGWSESRLKSLWKGDDESTSVEHESGWSDWN